MAPCIRATPPRAFPRKLDLAEKHGVNLEGALTWAFEFEGQPYFAGFRSLATNGIDKPVLNVFRMFSRMDGQRLRVESDGAVPLDELLKSGVREQARCLRPRRALRQTHHRTGLALPRRRCPRSRVRDITLDLTGAPDGSPKITRTLIDEGHSNSFIAWLAMGSPQSPTADQIRELEEASQLAQATGMTEVKSADGHCEITFSLARQGVTLLELEWP